MKKSPWVLLASLFLFFGCSDDDARIIEEPNEPTEDPTVQALTDTLNSVYDASILAGFAVTVIKNDEIAYQNTFGYANVAAGKKYENNTTQPIGSVSKTFIAAALVKAIEEGHFNLDTPINDILPFEVTNPHSPNTAITIKHLATHTSGLIDVDEVYEGSYFMLPGESTDLTPTMQAVVAFQGLEEGERMPLGDYLKAYYTSEGSLYSEDNFGEYEAGAEYEYSNIAASLTAYLIEVRTGMSYADYVEEKILNPLGINNASFDFEKMDESKAANLYFDKDNPYPRYGCHSYPDGFLNISNEDLGKYMLEMIRGKGGRGTILSDESYELLFQENILPNISGFAHGIFWDLSDGRIEHDGGDPGVITLLSFDPVKKTGTLFMTNIDTASDDGDTIWEQLLQMVTIVQAFEAE